jgi:hypothetical protein
MPSTYSNNLKIELIATGEQDTTWGNTTNTNLGTAIEQAIVGRAIVTFPTDADYTLPFVTSNAAQDARAVYLVVQGTISATRNLIVPTIFKNYVVKNDTTGSQDIVVKTSAGTGITVPNGKTVALYANGTNVIQESNHFDELSAVSPSFTGTPVAPTAAPGTNTTQLATTAFTSAAITAATGSLGTMSTQNANNVAITGGSISGITDLAVADGGTGASSFTANNVLLGNGSSSFQTVAPGTSGNVLVSNGTTWASTTISTGVNGQVFTGNGTFTIPAGVTRLKVTVVGGGGGGSNGGGFGQNGTRGGGGGGGAAIKWLTGLTPGNTLAVVVGAGGAGNAYGGNGGGNSTVSSGTQSISTITGGGGGAGAVTFGTWSTGGVGSGGDLNCRGGGAYSGSDGVGGNSILGGASADGGNPAAGGLYGGGGSSLFNGVSSAGAAGVVIFEW